MTQHTEPNTLKAISGNSGIHLYFRMDQSAGLKQLNNFGTLKVDGETYRVDGRGTGGVIFAPPSSYDGPHGKVLQYRWNAEPTLKDECVEGMSEYLVDLVNLGRAFATPSVLSLPETSSEVDLKDTIRDCATSHADALRPLPIQTVVSNEGSKACREVQDLLRKKANERAAVYGGSTVLPNGNRSFQFRVNGPRKCYLERQHNGSNNFTAIQGCAGDFQEVFYRCFGTACQEDNTRLLGKLSISAALEQVGVEAFGIGDRTVSCESNLRVRLQRPFMEATIFRSDWGAASIFAKPFEHDRRVIYDAGRFWIWNGITWVSCDSEAAELKSAFMYHMGRVKTYWLKYLTEMHTKQLVEAE